MSPYNIISSYELFTPLHLDSARECKGRLKHQIVFMHQWDHKSPMKFLDVEDGKHAKKEGGKQNREERETDGRREAERESTASLRRQLPSQLHGNRYRSAFVWSE